ncbi:uncharacterized protein LOC112345767 isoform X1 [Selaginella moellendorffii]|uniref:uncharacterized protein LOC112345767 isoform X1 n=1 Tax=Selaginella moellendorffii TaxID=88036 RepID=UPI000D1C605A|nr:uncharacterized protein LOC112345767 isoform X1 [Selaginella moellendorffii]|eukprot:XP_024528885.1 uncharacterized protein LOC112345767 isoform X1 [Selaginella moellendorffii]
MIVYKVFYSGDVDYLQDDAMGSLRSCALAVVDGSRDFKHGGASAGGAAARRVMIGGIARRNGASSSARVVAMAGVVVAEPVLCIGRTLVFYAFLQLGLAGRAASDEENGWEAWLQRVLFGTSGIHFFDFPLLGDFRVLPPVPGKRKNERNEQVRFRTKWHASTKGTLVRRYRVPTVSQGRKLLTAISSLLSSDDSFRDASSHKGCQIRRENAHAESVCCHNVRALLDQLPTPHLVVEITAFPPAPTITEIQYAKAEKIEQVLRKGVSI